MSAATPCPYNPSVSEAEFEYALKGAGVQAWKYSRRRGQPSLEIEDLEQEAKIGVIVAAERFDPTRGAKFSTWAFRYSYGFASNADRKAHRLPAWRQEQLAKLARPDLDPELQEKWALKPHERDTASLNTLIEVDYEPSWDGGIEAVAELSTLREQVEAAFATLPPADVQLVWDRLVNGRTFREMAGEHDVCHETVRQRFNAAVKRVREALVAAGVGE